MTGNSSPAVANNVTALLTVGLVALVVTAALAVIQHEPASTWIGIGGATVVWVLAVLAFNLDRKAFEANAHYTAAVAMFVAIIAVVGLNALHFGRTEKAVKGSTGRGVYANRYAVIAASMIVSVLAVLTWKWTAGFAHWVLAIEAALITLFAVFWVVQTVELWTWGLRPEPPASSDVPAQP